MSDIAKKSVETFAIRLGAQATALIGSIVIARTLGPAGKGLFTYAVSALALLVVANGQSAAIAWQYTKRHRAPATLLRVMMQLLVLGTVPLTIGLMLVGLLVPGQRALVCVAAVAPFAVFLQSSTGFFLADADTRTVNWQQIVYETLPVLVYIPLLLVFAQVGTWVLLTVWGSGYIAATWFTARRLREYARRKDGDDTGSLIREQLAYSAQISLANIAMFLNMRVDAFVIMFVLGQSALGIYSIGLAIGEILWQLSRPIVSASFGKIARGSAADSAQTTATCVRHALALALAGSTIVFVTAPFLVPAIYGRAFAPAVAVTQLLLPGVIAYSGMGALSTFFSQQLSEPRLPLIFRLLSAVICAGVMFVALPRFGIRGGAIGTSISYVLTFGLAAAQFCRRTGIPPQRLLVFGRSDVHPYRATLSRVLAVVSRRPPKPA